MKINSFRTPSADLKKIFWDVFFESKNRGIALERHFPWMENGSEDVVFFEATTSSLSTVGGLVLREKKCVIDGKEVAIGMIGLVCVTPEKRGNGIAGQLLNEVISYAKSRGLDYLTLWTSQHSIYDRYGFYVADRWCYGSVKISKNIEAENTKEFNGGGIFEENKILPIPPFATSVYVCSSSNCSFTALKDSEGYIVAGYNGIAANVAKTLIKALPMQWRLNVVEDDQLIKILANYGADINLSRVNLQMWLPLNKSNQANQFVDKITIPILERI